MKKIAHQRTKEKKLTIEDVNRLAEIREEISELLKETTEIVKRSKSTTTQGRYRSYVRSHIETALSDDHEWMAGSSTTMQDIIDELFEEVSQS